MPGNTNARSKVYGELYNGIVYLANDEHHIRMKRIIYVICVCLCIVVFNTYCVIFLLLFSSSCVPYVTNFSELSLLYYSFGIL